LAFDAIAAEAAEMPAGRQTRQPAVTCSSCLFSIG